ncbi:MAG: RagB/SusD family nutrient uptake outer membrane protein [Fermentimonas sp.]
MKTIINKTTLISLIILFLGGCNMVQLDLNPLSEGSKETWFSNDTEIRMSLDYLYTIIFWNPCQDPLNFDNGGWLDYWSDDLANRNRLSPITGGTINSETGFVVDWWKRYYNCIAAANQVIENLEKNKDQIETSKLNRYIAEARFVRARMYSKLIFYWGDVPYYENTLNIDEAFSMGRKNKEEILHSIYEDFDYAVSYLPESYSGKKYATKGAALALKAQIALYMNDYTTARDAAKECMDLGIYELYPNFSELFLSKTKGTKEAIFSIPRSVELGSWSDGYYLRPENVRHISPRSNGGNMYIWPSWDLFCSFLCRDGLPIDESPLFNPRKPFENRDPRCTATIVEFGTEHGGIILQPHPDSLTTINVLTGKRISNRDSRGVDQWASWNALTWKKGYDSDWWDDFNTDPEHMVIRYADLLLIYAEAKIELNEIDQTTLDAMNKVRARAYGVSYTETSSYPQITTTIQSELRQILRIERRMEFAFEGTRHTDIIRWRLAEKVLNIPNYGMIDPPELREKIIKPGLWFFPETPPIDEDGVADFSSMYNKGYCKLMALRYFDKTRHYLWPIPSKEILINDNIKQNPGY